MRKDNLAHRWVTHGLTAMTAASMLLATVACSKDKAEVQKGDQAETKAPAPSKSQARFPFLTKDADFVIGVNPGEFSSSALFQEMLKPMIADQSGTDYEQVKTLCGFDPLVQTKSVVFGGQSGKDDSIVVGVDGVNADQFEKCLNAMGEAEEESPEIAREGNLMKLTSPQGDVTWMGWTSDMTMLASPGATDKAAIEALLARDEGLDSNEALKPLVAKVDDEAGVWFAYKNTDTTATSTVPVQAEAVYGSIRFSDGLGINVRLGQASAEDAKKTVATMTEQVGQAKEQAGPLGKYLAKFELKADGSEVVIVMNMSNDELKELIPMLQQFAPMLMMGAMGGM